jgi:glycosyltransferase involved in cell wall biosynthesis
MRIGIDIHAAERDGSGNCTYVRGLLQALLSQDFENEYILYAIDKKHRFYRDIRLDAKVRLRPLPVENPLIRIPLFLGRATYRDALDVLHVQFIAPPFHKGRLVVTIHDLGFLHQPETFSKFEVLRSRVFVRMTAKRACRVITGSCFSRDDIIQTYRLDSRRVELVPYGVSPLFSAGLDSQKIDLVLDKYGIRKPYILSVGRLNMRKNLTSLFKAFALLKERGAIPHKLVIVGKEDYSTEGIFRAAHEIASGEVQFTGYVDDEDLPYVYSGADVFVYPSLFEGVGLPVLEAMACGVPVVASHTSSLREVVGEAGMTVDPLNAEEIAQCVLRLVEGGEFRKKYIKRGLERAGEFSWRQTALRTLDVYRTLWGGFK